MDTSRSSARIRTMFGLRYDLAKTSLLRKPHRVTQMSREWKKAGEAEPLEPISIAQSETTEAVCLLAQLRAMKEREMLSVRRRLRSAATTLPLIRVT